MTKDDLTSESLILNLNKEQLCQRLSYSSHKITHCGHIFFYVMHDVIWTTSSSAAHFKWCFTHLATLWLSFVSKRLNMALTHTHTHTHMASLFFSVQKHSPDFTRYSTQIYYLLHWGLTAAELTPKECSFFSSFVSVKKKKNNKLCLNWSRPRCHLSVRALIGIDVLFV